MDNTFNFPPSYAEELCNALIREELDIAWQCIIYPTRLHSRLVEKMSRAGCVATSLGFESGSPGVLRAMKKRFSPGDVQQASRELGAYGISRMGFLLLGGPDETRDSLQESIEFAEKLELESVKVTVGIRIYPHTALAEKVIARGVLGPDQDLLQPAFYLEPDLDGWLQTKTARVVEKRKNWQM